MLAGLCVVRLGPGVPRATCLIETVQKSDDGRVDLLWALLLRPMTASGQQAGLLQRRVVRQVRDHGAHAWEAEHYVTVAR